MTRSNIMHSLTAVAALVLYAVPLTAQGQSAQDRLWDAAIAGDTSAIARALRDGARIDSMDTRSARNGRLALNWAALNNHSAAITLLLAKGAPLEGENLTGFSALHHAAEVGALDAARTLLAAGADPTHANVQGRLPAETAEALGHPEVAALLRAAKKPQPRSGV